jgi:pyrroline-5-carboxylate reductase
MTAVNSQCKINFSYLIGMSNVMTKATIAIIGAGHMGISLLGGLIINGYPAGKIYLADPAREKLEHTKKRFHVHITTNNALAIKTADVVIFAVKPDKVAEIAKELSSIIQQRQPLVISIAAGIRQKNILQWLGGGRIPIVRAMPNTPALIGCGASALYANPFISAKQHSLAESILRSVGTVVWVKDEKQMDVVTALSGSGPAYFYLIMEAMQNAGETLGLSQETARVLTIQTAYGAARLALESEKTLSELRQQAMTAGGTTEQGIRVLEENNIRGIIDLTLNAATDRAKELGSLDESNNRREPK